MDVNEKKCTPLQPVGLYKIYTEAGVYHGLIENMTYSQIFIWNEVLNTIAIFKFSDVSMMIPIEKYPECMYQKEKKC